MSYIEWPLALRPRVVNIQPPSKTRSLSVSLTEFEQVVPVVRPPWRVTLEFGSLPACLVLTYRALLAACEGRANLIRLPLFDMKLWASDVSIGAGGVPHSDDSPFSDAALYMVTDLSGVTVSGVQGAKQVTADFGSYGQILKAGHYFGIGDDMHIVTAIEWSGSVATIKFTSSLRRSVTNAPLKLRPNLICRLADDDTGEHPLRYLRRTEPVISFVEAFYEPLS